MVVWGKDGMDEISLGAATLVGELKDGEISEYEIHPEDYGLQMVSNRGLRVADAAESKAMLLEALANTPGTPREIVTLNAGAALYAANLAASVADGIAQAREAIASGAARAKLDAVRRLHAAVQMSDILQQILAVKREEVAAALAAKPLAVLRAEAEAQPPPRDFVGAILRAKVSRRRSTAVIAEIKKASPSKGVIRADFRPGEIAASYAAHGAACLSVLTDRQFFQGAPEYLVEARAACALPVLRKDFIIDAYQVFEARAMGADCILLIVAAFLLGTLPARGEGRGEGRSHGCAHSRPSPTNSAWPCWSRCTTPPSSTSPCSCRRPLVGINNRNLRSFEVSLETTRSSSPASRLTASSSPRSGILAPADVALMQAHDVKAFLVGEAFMRAADPGVALAALSRPDPSNGLLQKSNIPVPFRL